MHPSAFERLINEALLKHNVVVNAANQSFYERLQLHISAVSELYNTLYGGHPEAALCFYQLIENVVAAYAERSTILKSIDNIKLQQDHWFLSNDLVGMSLYVDRFCGQLNALSDKLPYLKNLAVNFLHVMPLFKSPTNESDGGYAVSDFREVDEKFGTLQDLQQLINQLQQEGFYLMIDIVLNHTSHHHEWAQKAKAREKQYQDYYYMFDDRGLPDAFDSTMPEVFPEVAPGNFTWNEECSKWVMTVFHNYQWDLNYTNPQVFIEMLNNIFFYANLGIDVLRIDAPAFIWKQLGTTCQNLPKAHILLRLIKQCVAIATPGMALL
jgi:amylosucrase